MEYLGCRWRQDIGLLVAVKIFGTYLRPNKNRILVIVKNKRNIKIPSPDVINLK